MTAQRVFIPSLAIRALRNGTLMDDVAAQSELARYLEATSRAQVPEGLIFGDRINDADIGPTGASDTLVISRKLVLVDPTDASRSITLDPATVTIASREGGFMLVTGAKFGADDDLFWWVGGEGADVEAVTKAAAFHAYANESGQLVEYGGVGGSINWSAADNDAQASDTVTVTHSDDGTTAGTTNGNDITVTMSYSLYRWGFAASDISGSISADLILTRNYNGGGAVSVATPTATGQRTTIGDGFSWRWTEVIEWTDTYTDSTGDVQDRVFVLELDALNGLASPAQQSDSVMTLATSEPA